MAQVANRLPAESGFKSLKLPGMPWILLGLVIFFFAGIRTVLFHWGVPLPLRFISQFSGILGSLTLVWGVRRYVRVTRVNRMIIASHRWKVFFWHGLLIVLFVAGLLEGNLWNAVGKEFIILWLFGEFWIIGADDRFWYLVEKPLTIMFYISALLIFFYYTTPGIVVNEFGVEQVDRGSISPRYINTLGYDLRPLLGSGMFLFVWGVVRPRNNYCWRSMQIGALFISFIITVGLFKFRSAAFSYAALVIIVLLLRPMIEKQKRLGTTAFLLSTAIVGLWIFTQTTSFDILMNRLFVQTQTASIFESRINELSAYIKDLGWHILIGRGLGGSYDASAAIPTIAAYDWQTTHFGILVFSLKGGILMLGGFLLVLLPGFKLRPNFWYRNPINLMAALLLPLLTFNFFLNPFLLAPDSIFIYLPAMGSLARFGRRIKYDANIYANPQFFNSIQESIPAKAT